MRKRFALLILTYCLTLANAFLFSQTTIGVFDGHNDVGEVTKPGEAIYIATTRQYVISGAGYNIWDDHDEFHFVWKKVKGDFIAYARGEFVGAGVEAHRKIGWMARSSLEGNAPHINAVVHGD